MKSSSGFVAEVVLGLLLAAIMLALAAVGCRYWLKKRAQGSGMAVESNIPQGFDNITFRDVSSSSGAGGCAGLSCWLSCPQQRQNNAFLKLSKSQKAFGEPTACQHVREGQRALPLI